MPAGLARGLARPGLGGFPGGAGYVEGGQGLCTHGIDRCDRDRLGVPLFQRLFGRIGLVGPFGRAAEDVGGLDRHRLARQQRVDRFSGVVAFGRLDLAVVDAAFIAQLPAGIEDEHVGRRQAAIGMGSGLGVAVVEVGEFEAALFGADLHLLEAVGQVGVAQLVEPQRPRVVGVDGGQGHAFVLVVGVQLHDPPLVGLCRRAMIAGEDDHQQFRVAEILQAVSLPVNAGQIEVGGGRSDGQRLDLFVLMGGRLRRRRRGTGLGQERNGRQHRQHRGQQGG